MRCGETCKISPGVQVLIEHWPRSWIDGWETHWLCYSYRLSEHEGMLGYHSKTIPITVGQHTADEHTKN